MAIPIYIAINPNEPIVVSGLKWIKPSGNNVLLGHVDGSFTSYPFSSSAAALAKILEITQLLSDTMNAPIFDLVNSTPGLTVPPDQTRGCLWFGVGGTFYTWNPSTKLFVGVIIP